MSHIDAEKLRTELRESLTARVEKETRDLAFARTQLATAAITADNEELTRLVRYTAITLSFLGTYETMLAALDSDDPASAMLAAARGALHPAMAAIAISAARALADLFDTDDCAAEPETTRTVDSAEAAEQLQGALHDAFPTTRLTVVQKQDAPTRLLVTWSEGPTRADMLAVAERFLGLHNGGKDGDWTGNEVQMVVTAAGELPELVRYRVDGVAGTRTHSDATVRAVATKLIAQNPDLFTERAAPDAGSLPPRELGEALKLFGGPDDVIMLDGLPVHAPGHSLADALAHTLRHTDMTGAEQRQKEN